MPVSVSDASPASPALSAINPSGEVPHAKGDQRKSKPGHVGKQRGDGKEPEATTKHPRSQPAGIMPNPDSNSFC